MTTFDRLIATLYTICALSACGGSAFGPNEQAAVTTDAQADCIREGLFFVGWAADDSALCSIAPPTARPVTRTPPLSDHHQLEPSHSETPQ